MRRFAIWIHPGLVQDYKDKRKKNIINVLHRGISEQISEVKFVSETDRSLVVDINIDAETDEIRDKLIEIMDLSENDRDGVRISFINISDEKPEEKVQVEKSKEFEDYVTKISGLKSLLDSNVLGQQYAIDRIISGLINAKTTETDNKNYPLAVFTLLGPHGIGKTYITKIIAFYFKKELSVPFISLNRSNYSDENIVKKITSFVRDNPHSIVIFDDADDTSKDIEDMLAQVFDVGEYDEVSFRKTIMFFTTSVGESIYNVTVNGNLSNVSSKAIVNALLTERSSDSNYGTFARRTTLGLSKGKLLMLNYLEPMMIKQIVETKLKEKFDLFTKNTGIEVKYNAEQLSTSIMYMNDGEYNAKSISEYLDKFIETEINDIFRQKDLGSKSTVLNTVKTINFEIDLKHAPEVVKELYAERKLTALVICDKANSEKLSKAQSSKVELLFADTIDDAKLILHRGVDFVLLDVMLNIHEMEYLPTDLEDYDSDGVELFNYITTYYNEVPLYIFSDASAEFTYEDYASFINKSAKNVLFFNDKKTARFSKSLKHIQKSIELEADIAQLIKDKKALTYNSSQEVNADCTEINVKLSKLNLSFGVHNVRNASLLVSSYSSMAFNDIVGCDDAKRVLGFYGEYIKNTRKYLDNGVKAPNGLLIYGEEGTGKSLLVKALSGETGATLIQKNSSEVITEADYKVDSIPKVIRDLFKTAKDNSPSILLLDDVDKFLLFGDPLAAEKIFKSIVSEMQTANLDEKHPVLFICTTNEGKDELPKKFTKELDREIGIALPNEKEREEYIEKYLARHSITTISKSIIHNFALRTVYESCGYIANIIDFVIRNAYGETITDEMLVNAIDLIENGEERKKSKESVLSTAYHEMGHALIEYELGNHPSFITVVSRGDYGGYTMSDMHEENSKSSKKYFLDHICMSLGGRAAEYVVYGDEGINSGASSDLESATLYARYIVCNLAMGTSLLCYRSVEHEALPERVLNEIEDVLQEQYKRAIQILTDNRKLLDYLADLLAKKNSMTGEEMEDAIKEFNK